MTEEQKSHWIEDEHTRRRFWAYVRGDLGLSKDEVHAALAVASVKDYTGTPAEAKADVDKFAIIKLGDLAQRLPESPVLAWTEFTSRAGLRWTVSVRGGLPAGLAALGLQQLEAQMDAVEALAQRRNGSAERTQQPQPATGAPPPPEPPTPPAQSGAPSPPPQAQAPGGNGGEETKTLMTEFVKVTAPKGKPVIEFWRPNRQYPEITYGLGGARFLELAPALAQANWTPEHFDTVGAEYQIPLMITWEPSPKNPKWKDITAASMR